MSEPEKKKETFSITLPKQAVEMIEGLIEEGLYGTSRAEIARQLILDQLKAIKQSGR